MIKRTEILKWAILALALLTNILSLHKAQKEKDLRKQAESNLQIEVKKKIVYGKDSSQAKVETQVANKDQVKVIVQNDHRIKEMGIRIKDLQTYVATHFDVKGMIHDTFVILDTVFKIRSFTSGDGYLILSCQDSSGIMDCSYTYSDSALVVVHTSGPTWYIPWTWFKKRKVNTSVSFSNSKTVIRGVRAVVRKD
jgi:hypothetical protein